ncbi:MAG: hypothetical protein JST80_11135 [Bdellovibrionales bacterium]|nr:hypothetical protein [Bdellovibrionales bacterium]
MKKIIFGLIATTSISAFASDFTMVRGSDNTISVQGCGYAEVSDVMIKPSITGDHKLTSRCLPIFCLYRNETPYAIFNTGTKWTIALSARDASRDSKSPVFKGSPQFDRRFDKVLNKGIKTKAERDNLIQKYLNDGVCKGVHFDQNIPSV